MCRSAAFSFHFFSPLPSGLPRGSFCVGLRVPLESFDLSCCLYGFCRVEFPTLGVFLRSRQPADSQADRPAGESAAIPSVEVFYFRSGDPFHAAWGPLGPARHFLDLIFCVSGVFHSHFSSSCKSFSRLLSDLVFWCSFMQKIPSWLPAAKT